jgi:hypothetical protein
MADPLGFSNDPLERQFRLEKLLRDTLELSTPDIHEDIGIERQRESVYLSEYRRQDILKREKEVTESPFPWELGAIRGGMAAGHESIGAAILRSFDPETADWMVRNSQADQMAREMGMERVDLNKWRRSASKRLFSASRSFTQAAILTGGGYLTGGTGIAALGAGFAATSAHETYVSAIDYGLRPKDALGLAVRNGFFEASIMTTFSALGMGGFERLFTGGTAAFSRAMWKDLVKDVGMHTLAELSEEELTTVLQEMDRVATMPTGKYPNAWIGDDQTFQSSPMYSAMIDTAKDTIAMMGMGQSARATKFLFNPSRNTISDLQSEIPELVVDLQEKHGDLRDEVNREAASDDLRERWVQTRGALGKLEDDIAHFESVATDEDRTEAEVEEAENIVSGLRGVIPAHERRAEATGALVDEWLKRPTAAPETVGEITLKANAETTGQVPQTILNLDPNARLIDPLDLVPQTEEQEELIRLLQTVKELSAETRGGRAINFVQTSNPEIGGLYSGDGIYITVPTLEKHMKGGKLSKGGLRKALAGTFAHEFFHEFKRKDPTAWQSLYDTLAADPKYAKILKEGEARFDKTVEEAPEFYTGRSDEQLAELRTEEGLSYLMTDHFISTGMVSKIAKTNASAMDLLGDWLRRIRNALFRDPLYRGLNTVFNKVSGDLGLEPVEPVKEADRPSKPASRKKKPKKRSKSQYREEKGLPEWAVEAYAKLKVGGSKVTKKNFVSNSSVVVTVKTKAGNRQIVLLQPEVKDGKVTGGVAKRVVKTTKGNFTDKLEEAIFDAEAYDVSLKGLLSDTYYEGMAINTLKETFEGKTGDPVSDLTGQFSGDYATVAQGLKEGFSDEETTIEKTDIVPFSEKLKEAEQTDEGGAFLTEEQAEGIDTESLVNRGLVYKQDDKYRLSGYGTRVLAWEPRDEVGVYDEGEAGEPDVAEFAIDGYTDTEAERISDTIGAAGVFLLRSEFAGRGQDLIDAIWEGDHLNPIVVWLRNDNSEALTKIINGVWPNDKTTRRLIEEMEGSTHTVSDIKIRLLTGKDIKRGTSSDLTGPKGEMLINFARSVVPSPAEYRQFAESEERFSISLDEIPLPPEYWDEGSKHFVDEKTRRLYDQVGAYKSLRIGKEHRSQIEDEIWGQTEFNRDKEGEIARLIRMGLDGHIFTSKDWVVASEAHAWLTNLLKDKNLTELEREAIKQKQVYMAMYSRESAAEWGRAGAMMRDRQESARERGERMLNKLLYNLPDKIARRIARQRLRFFLGGDAKKKAQKKIAELREEWAQAALDVEERLRQKHGWDLDHLDKYLGNRRAIEQIAYGIKKEKGDVGGVANIVYEVFINFILSGPLTQAANISSNLIFTAYELGPKRWLEATLNEGALIVGAGDVGAARLGELPHLYAGMVRGFVSGASNFWTALIYEEATFEKSLGHKNGRRKFDQSFGHHIPGVLGRLVRGPGTTLLTAFDEWQKTVNTYAQVQATAYRAARSQGMDEKGTGAFIAEVLDNKQHPIWNEALTEARRLVFQQDPIAIAKAAVSARTQTPGLRYLLPFIVTPTNIVETGISYSPLGVFSPREKGVARSIWRGFSTGDWSDANPKVAQQMVVWAIAAMLMSEDEDEDFPLITGTNPDQPKFWAEEKRGGAIPPLSVRVGKGPNGMPRYLSFGRFEPAATIFGVIADGVKAVKTGKPFYTVERLAESVIEITKDKTFMRTLTDLAWLAKDPLRGGERIVGNLATPWIPNWYKQTVRSRKDYVPDRRTWGEGDDRLGMWGRNIARKYELGLVKEYAQYDVYGEKVDPRNRPHLPFMGDAVYALTVPAKMVEVHPRIADKLLRRYNTLNPEDPKGVMAPQTYFEISGREDKFWLSKQQYAEYSQLAGKIFAGLADSEASDIKDPPAHYIESLWEGNWSAAKTAAREILWSRWEYGVENSKVAIEISNEIHARNLKKRYTTLAKLTDALWQQDKETKRLDRNTRMKMLKAEQDKTRAKKTEAIEWLATQGIDYKALKGMRGGVPNKGRILRSFREMGLGGESNGRKRNVSRGVRGDREAPRLEASRLR